MKSLFLRALLLVLLTSIMTAGSMSQESPRPVTPTADDKRPEPRGLDVLRQFNGSLEALVSKVSPAVVQIQAAGLAPLRAGNKSGVAVIVRQRAIGSGVIVDSDGYIMTNAHVVEGAQRVRIVLPVPPSRSPAELTPVGKRQVLDARVVGTHKDSDLALLKVEGHNFPTLPLGARRPVQPGELVFAVGSPEGLQNSVTMGVVSAVWRQPDPDKPMVYIQTDAPINPGNSGGPLVDLDGYVVGLNTFILSEGGGNEGLGFAIPARIVKFVYDNLRKYGHVNRTEIQASAQDITPTLAAGLGLAQNWGVVISDVTPGGPADAAGLKIRDIVVSVDSRPILGVPGLTAALYLHPPDEVVGLEVLRGTEKLLLNVPALVYHDKADQLADFIDPNNRFGILGVYVMDYDERMRAAMPDVRIPSGVVVLGQSLDFSALTGELHAGDIIHAVNRVPIHSTEQLRSALQQLKLGDPLVLQIERQKQLQYVDSEME
ncbi:MAG TPA: trypsin-like peptidase domain-containing protein [Terriglobales bacterium]|jgi:serine protease Do|nr:trypsin-like peptidase domain-containing protein [Terriglobales bacterium]